MAESAGRQPIFIASWNGGPATARAAELAVAGEHLLDSIVAGIQLVEDDPEEMSVGYGGLPNEEGVVELDAAVMDAATHRAGAVAGVRGYRHVARLALEVMRRTDHSLLVGEGAARFARQLGFPLEDLLTPRAREAWLLWKANLSDRDAWLPAGGGEGPVDFGKAAWAGRDPRFGATSATADLQRGRGDPGPGESGGAPAAPFTFGTIHVSGLIPGVTGSSPAIACCTSTSGLSYKIPGRVGDSAVVGAGLYCDAGVGSAGATGRGESVLQACGSFSIVREMERGATPTQACLTVLKQIADRTREKRLLDARGRPTFNVTLYALRADGLVGSASMHEGYTHVVQRGNITTVEASAFLFGKGG
jgi:N4-(beta-N-acetylglucosaminyl)-L-asparaginase